MPRKKRTDWPPQYIVFKIICAECGDPCWANKKTAVYCCTTCRVHAHENRVARKERDLFDSEEPSLPKLPVVELDPLVIQESRKSATHSETPIGKGGSEIITWPLVPPRYSVEQMKAMERPVLTEGYVEVRPGLETAENKNIRYCALVDHDNKIKGRLTSLDPDLRHIDSLTEGNDPPNNLSDTIPALDKIQIKPQRQFVTTTHTVPLSQKPYTIGGSPEGEKYFIQHELSVALSILEKTDMLRFFGVDMRGRQKSHGDYLEYVWVLPEYMVELEKSLLDLALKLKLKQVM